MVVLRRLLQATLSCAGDSDASEEKKEEKKETREALRLSLASMGGSTADETDVVGSLVLRMACMLDRLHMAEARASIIWVVSAFQVGQPSLWCRLS